MPLLNGERILLVYLIVYLLGWGTQVSIVWINFIFCFLHAVFLFWAVFAIRKIFSMFSRGERLFWLLLLAMLIMPGAYLEYPSDAWTHIQRTLNWQSLHEIGESSNRYKFAYFFNWTLIGWVPIEDRRVALSVISGFWQFLVAIGVFKLALRLGFSRIWAMIQVVAFFAFFGTSLFSLRYYALSSMPMAYFAFLISLTRILDFSEKSPRSATARLTLIFNLVTLLLLMAFNHLQEVLFFLIAGTTILLGNFYRRQSFERRKVLRNVALGLFIGTIFWGFYYRYRLDTIFNPFGQEHVSRIGSLPVWTISPPHGRYLETWGLHGVLSLICAIIFFRKNPLIAGLTLLPLLLLICPIFVVGFGNFAPDAQSINRLIFMFPTSICLVMTLRNLGMRVFPKWSELQLVSGVFIVTTLSGLIYGHPWRGRLFFQFYQAPVELTLAAIDEAAAWIKKNRRYDPECQIFSDDNTLFVLTTHLGKPIRQNRLITSLNSEISGTAEGLLGLTRTVPPVCAVIVARLPKVPVAPPSLAARSSLHWVEERGSIHKSMPEHFSESAEKLLSLGWTKTEIPPFYDLYEPPADWKPI